MRHFEQSMYTLIEQTSTVLPADVRKAIQKAKRKENEGTRAALALTTIANNIDMAETNVSPICQDTGMPTFVIHTPIGMNQLELKRQIHSAIVRATKDGLLRPNSMDSLTGINSGDNLGIGTPVIHFEQWEKDDVEVRLILKGGGCENKNIQYSLPADLEGVGRAGRDLDGVRKCIMHAVYQAQGQGCSAGFIGVGIGGDRTTGYELAKMQLFREVDDVNENEDLRKLEQYVMDNADQLGIGTMGFGGEATLLGCKIGAMHRLPASFFVSVAYNCWAFRRQGVVLDGTSGEIRDWLYERGNGLAVDGESAPSTAGASASSSSSTPPVASPSVQEASPYAAASAVTVCDTRPEPVVSAAGSGKRQFVLQAPLTEKQIRELRVGDVVIINGTMFTGRDALHKYFMDHDSPVDLDGAVLYHCGPVMLKNGDEWVVKAAGPTTSMREEPYQGHIMKKFGIRAVIGKGGMGSNTLQALKEHGGVYLNAIGGAAQYYAETIKRVDGVHFLKEFGIPEAMWQFQVEGFAAIVTMDAHGNSLHADVEKSALEKLAKFKEPVFK